MASRYLARVGSHPRATSASGGTPVCPNARRFQARPGAPGPAHRRTGPPALQQAWYDTTGQPVPQPVLDYIAAHPADDQPADTP